MYLLIYYLNDSHNDEKFKWHAVQRFQDTWFSPEAESIAFSELFYQAIKEAFTAEEVRLMLEHLPEDQVGWGIRLMLCTGMRTQELLGLEPRHIAEDGSWITIEQAVVMEKGSAEIGPPKSQDSYRTVPIPRSVQYCARLLRAVDTKFIWERGKRDKPCNPSYFRKNLRKSLKGLKGFGF